TYLPEPTYLPTFLPAYLPTYVPTSLPTHPPTYPTLPCPIPYSRSPSDMAEQSNRLDRGPGTQPLFHVPLSKCST
ncbi:hypothetical protein T484DRAFT_1650424, partial [Baffinella frigidus]